MDYINYVKQSPMMGQIGLGGGAASLGRYQSSGGGSTRGLFAAGYNPETDRIDYITIETTSNATDFGDLMEAQQQPGSCASNTRGVVAGGHSGGEINRIQYVTIANAPSNASDFGDLITAQHGVAGLSNQTRGVFCGGTSDGTSMEYITIANTSNATNFGDGSIDARNKGSCASTTRGIICGGGINTINYITIASTSNTTDFGDLNWDAAYNAGASNNTRGILSRGDNNRDVDYITIATTSNGTDFGDILDRGKTMHAMTSSPTRVVKGGGADSNTAGIDYATIMSPSAFQDFGDLSTSGNSKTGFSNGHGGL